MASVCRRLLVYLAGVMECHWTQPAVVGWHAVGAHFPPLLQNLFVQKYCHFCHCRVPAEFARVLAWKAFAQSPWLLWTVCSVDDLARGMQCTTMVASGGSLQSGQTATSSVLAATMGVRPNQCLRRAVDVMHEVKVG